MNFIPLSLQQEFCIHGRNPPFLRRENIIEIVEHTLTKMLLPMTTWWRYTISISKMGGLKYFLMVQGNFSSFP